MNKKKWFVLTLAALLLLSVFAFAIVALAEDGETPPPFISGVLDPADGKEKEPTATPGLGLLTPSPSPKPTPTPKPKPTPTPEPTEYPFEPGLREDHEGHKIEYRILDSNDWRHTIKEYCSTCRMTIKDTYTEDHQLDADGHCTKCGYQCKHDSTFVREVPADGGEKTWDGEWISYPGTEITVCNRCGKYLKYENTIIRMYHNMHTRYLMPTTWLPKDDKNHCADVVCLDCDVTFEVTKYHNFTGDAPFEDDGDPDTHTHQIVCKDCGFTAERREPHAWVHDSYKKDETVGGGEGHIEVFKCTVCGAVKEVKQPHDAGTHIAYVTNGSAETHTEVLQCGICKEQFEADRPHELEHDSYRNDGNNETHIDVQVCTVCKQKVETGRVSHKFVHIAWKSVSDTQDQETVRCNICGFESVLAPVAHQFDGLSYESNDIQQHTIYKTCSKCGERQKNGEPVTERHDFSNNEFCKKCNQSMKHKGPHWSNSYLANYWIPFDEKNHAGVFQCAANECRAYFVNNMWLKEHTFDPVTMKCTGCGYLKEGCEHTPAYRPVPLKSTSKEHTLTGNCTKCGKQITITQAHSMQFDSATEWTDNNDGRHIRTVTDKCTVCGFPTEHRETEEHKCVFVSATENKPCENGHERTVTEQCSVCGAFTERKETESHGFSPEAQYADKQTHKKVCAACGFGKTEKHTFPATSDTCKYCGCKDEHEHEFTKMITSKSLDVTNHVLTYQCELCTEQKNEYGKHIGEVLYIGGSIDHPNKHLARVQCKICLNVYIREWLSCRFYDSDVCAICHTKKK